MKVKALCIVVQYRVVFSKH